ncbi:hypothetical protein [Streptomyces sp. IBSBF 3136]|uniref:hypothetical protein n=1 Tax=Streptomyces sp. IBSBF 3136 TaxID=2903524 RepID=UPI002FDC2033
MEKIPTLDPGQAVWKVGPAYVDIIETVLSDDEARLTDTSTRRRAAQKASTAPADTGAAAEQEPLETDTASPVGIGGGHQQDTPAGQLMPMEQEPARDGDWGMQPDQPDLTDRRHHDVIQAASEGRGDEAAQLAALGTATRGSCALTLPPARRPRAPAGQTSTPRILRSACPSRMGSPT